MEVKLRIRVEALIDAKSGAKGDARAETMIDGQRHAKEEAVAGRPRASRMVQVPFCYGSNPLRKIRSSL